MFDITGKRTQWGSSSAIGLGIGEACCYPLHFDKTLLYSFVEAEEEQIGLIRVIAWRTPGKTAGHLLGLCLRPLHDD